MEHKFINSIEPDKTSASIYLYGGIGEGGDARVNGDDFARELRYLDKSVDLVNLHINSGGGDVFHGFSIISAMRSMITPVAVYIDGIAASMAAIIAVSGDTIYMHDYSMLMIHDPFMGSGEKATKKQQKLLDKVKTSLIKILSSRDIPPEVVSDLMAEEVWFSALEAKERGLCDEILASATTSALAEIKPEEVLSRVMNSYEKSIINQTQKTETMSITAAAAAALNIAADASTEAVSSGVVSMASELSKAKTELAELKKEKAEARKVEVSNLLNEAIRTGRIDASARDAYQTLFDKDFEAASKALASLPKPAGIASQLGGGVAAGAATANDLEAMSWSEIDKANRLAELKNKYPELYGSKFEAKFGHKPIQ